MRDGVGAGARTRSAAAAWRNGGDLNMEIVPLPLPPQKLPKFPPRIINPREFRI